MANDKANAKAQEKAAEKSAKQDDKNNGFDNGDNGKGGHGPAGHISNGHDVLVGTPGDDFIHGGNGKDKVFGGDGDDYLHGGNGKDKVSGGPGDDVVKGGNGKDKLKGGDGDDTIYGGNGKDEIYGDAGDDTIYGGRGKDFIAGGTDNGTFQIAFITSEELLINGSFEDGPDMNPESFAQFENGLVPGWTNLGGDVIEVWTPPLTDFGIEIEATDGSRLIETDAEGGQDVYAQTVTLGVGGNLVLTFDYASRPGVDQPGNDTDSFEIWWNGEMVGYFDPDTTEWQSATIELVGVVGDNLLEIREAGANDNHGALLDNFSLVYAEPAGLLISMDGGDQLWGGKGADTFYYAFGDGVDTIHDYSKKEGDKIVLKLYDGITHDTIFHGGDAYILFQDDEGYVENAAIKVVGISSLDQLDIQLV